MADALLTRLELYGPLTDDEKHALRDAVRTIRTYEAREVIVPQGSTPSDSTLLIEGFAIRHLHLADGKRQIAAVHIPGDFADLHGFLLKKLDDGVEALSPCTVALLPHEKLKRITRQFPHLTRALWFTTLLDAAIMRQWMSSIGRMSAAERLAHFICEMHDRLGAVDLASERSFSLPIRQEDLGDAFGLSTVHVNRSLQELRKAGLVQWTGRTVTIGDREALQELGKYNPDYLHLGVTIERDPRQVDEPRFT